MLLDTIVAVSTANAVGGIGIVRLSGSKSVEIADKLFKGKIKASEMESHSMHLGKIVLNGEVTDTVLICVFKAPKSYTGETVVEINCHGGIYVCKMVLEACIYCGARLAEPGEFTKRAFLNGKLDLIRAEAVTDIISAETKTQVFAAANQLDKILSNKIEELRSSLLDTTGHLMAMVDFSEEGIEDMPHDEMIRCIENAKAETEKLLSTADDGRIIKHGINAVIIGAPNVGKSSLLNALNGEERAIVTEIEGTTRDILETEISIRGIKINLFDTAGIRLTDDVVEKIGVERAQRAIANADVIFFVADATRQETLKDEYITNSLIPEKTICIINKCDLSKDENINTVFSETVYVSAKTGEGIDKLCDIIENKYKISDITERAIITNPRHKESLIKADSLLHGIIDGFNAGVPFDILLGDIELVIEAFGEINGMSVSEEIIDNIFANFCVGK